MTNEVFRVLIVESDVDFSNRLSSVLSPPKYFTEQVTSCTEASKLLSQPETNYHVVLVAHFIADGEGIQLIKDYSDSPHNYAFIILTESQNLNLTVESIQAGASDYIVKSENAANIVALVVEKTITTNRLKIERKELEDRLRESEEKYRSLTENSEDVIMRFDRAHKHLYANPATSELLGIDYKEFIGKTHEELGFQQAEYEYWESKIDEVFNTNRPLRIISPFDNERIWFDWSLIPELNENGEVENVLSYSRDITRLVKAEQALKKSQEQLKELNSTKDKLFSIIGHDLRGPIGGLRSLLQMSIEELEQGDSEDLAENLKICAVTASCCSELLENLLQWAKTQQDEVAFHPQSMNLSACLNATLSVLSQLALAKDIVIHNTVSSDIEVVGDKNVLSTVVRNLIGNAIKFTEPNNNIYISANQTSTETIIHIKDEGVGMSVEVQEKIFQNNEHFTTFGTSGEKGSGLGLILCQEFIAKHGGEIWVQSTPEEGSTFSFSLPLDIPSEN